MSIVTIHEIVRQAIADEGRLPEEFHKGRVHAFTFVLELLQEHMELPTATDTMTDPLRAPESPPQPS